MSDVLVTIKRAVLAGRFAFSDKAELEMFLDGLTELDVVESIANARAINKRLRSTHPAGSRAREYLYVILSPNLAGKVIYTKGKFVRNVDQPMYYFLVSSKRAW